jgi:hypothetical protein
MHFIPKIEAHKRLDFKSVGAHISIKDILEGKANRRRLTSNSLQQSILQAQYRIKRSKNNNFYIGHINYKLKFTPTTCITITLVSLKCEGL